MFTNIHNTQHEDKQTYTIHSTKTRKHTQYTVRRQTNIHNTQCLFVFVLCVVYVCLSSYCVLCMFVCLRSVHCVCLFVFVLCIVYVFLSSYYVLCIFEEKQTYITHSTKTNKHTQYTAQRQTNIHNRQYEDKKTYTILVLCIVYVCLFSYCVLCMFVCLRNVHCVCFLVSYTIRRQTRIHNTQYEDKQTYTMRSTTTNKHTKHTV
jgi:uncharacterized membrane protein YgcG